MNWVIPHASSTCEMVYRLYRELKIEIDADAALMLYSGMMVDTGSFRYNNASAKSYRVAASLIEKGVSPVLFITGFLKTANSPTLNCLVRFCLP